MTRPTAVPWTLKPKDFSYYGPSSRTRPARCGGRSGRAPCQRPQGKGEFVLFRMLVQGLCQPRQFWAVCFFRQSAQGGHLLAAEA